MSRRLFCEISPLTYRISVAKERLLRRLRDTFSHEKFAKTYSDTELPVKIYHHKSLIRRKLGNVDMRLQENKAVNLSIAAPKVSGVLIKPGETFSFWHLVGSTSAKKGYLEGLFLTKAGEGRGIGGGLCQFTNLLHWMALHSELRVVEHHHHDGLDMFRDYGRQVPFGTGTSIAYNYLDYRLFNPTSRTYQFIVYTDDEYLCGELRASEYEDFSWHIHAENECFRRENGTVYRCGEVWRERTDKRTGNVVERELVRRNHARVAYDTDGLEIIEESD